jgi:TIR domain
LWQTPGWRKLSARPADHPNGAEAAPDAKRRNIGCERRREVADVFISYASEDRDRARSLAKVLETGGLSVWWDRKIVPGQSFDQTIERELDAAKSAVVLWSTASISSGWVKSEASAARQRGILVPAMIDDVKIPLGFRDIQCANLVG